MATHPYTRLWPGKTSAPGAAHDSTAGYEQGDVWVDSTNHAIYICSDDTEDAAVWILLGSSAEAIQDIVGAMFSSNTETNIVATYQDSDGTMDLEIEDVAFGARQTVAQTGLATGTNHVAIFNVEDIDTHGYYNTSNGRFTPLKAGTYHFDALVTLTSLGDGKQLWIGFRKNGANPVWWGSAQTIGASASPGANGSMRFYMDGVDDYIEVILWHNHGSNRDTNVGGANDILMHFSGYRVSFSDVAGK